jgi:hypothetical protein
MFENPPPNPYQSPSEIDEDYSKPITDKQAANRLAVRGCLASAVIGGGGIALFLSGARKIVNEDDLMNISPYFIAWVTASIGCTVWQILAAKIDRKKTVKNIETKHE